MKYFQAIMAIILWQSAVIPTKFDSSRVKWDLISRIIIQLPHDLPNDLRVRILGNQ